MRKPPENTTSIQMDSLKDHSLYTGIIEDEGMNMHIIQNPLCCGTCCILCRIADFRIENAN